MLRADMDFAGGAGLQSREGLTSVKPGQIKPGHLKPGDDTVTVGYACRVGAS
jgi:hypothetical protein